MTDTSVFKPGQRVIWHSAMRPYAIIHYRATVITTTAKRVFIRTRNGCRRCVRPDRLSHS